MKNSSLISIALIIGLSYQPVLPAQEESTAKKLVDYTKGTVIAIATTVATTVAVRYLISLFSSNPNNRENGTESVGKTTKITTQYDTPKPSEGFSIKKSTRAVTQYIKNTYNSIMNYWAPERNVSVPVFSNRLMDNEVLTTISNSEKFKTWLNQEKFFMNNKTIQPISKLLIDGFIKKFELTGATERDRTVRSLKNKSIEAFIAQLYDICVEGENLSAKRSDELYHMHRVIPTFGWYHIRYYVQDEKDSFYAKPNNKGISTKLLVGSAATLGAVAGARYYGARSQNSIPSKEPLVSDQ
jgi:hypothetical protein